MTAALPPLDGPVRPSGRQHPLRHGDQEAVVVEVGGGLRSYTAGGRDVLDGYAEDARCSGARGQPLIPWPNRLDGGRYTWDGVDHLVAWTEPNAGNAIHGFTRFSRWECRRYDHSALVMHHLLYPQPGYPFALESTVGYRLTDEGLTVTVTGRNVGTAPLPWGAGAHPYLRPTTPAVDGATLQAPGASYLPTDDRGIPTGVEPVAGTPYDFRSPRQVGDTRLDLAFGDLDRDGDGRAWVRLVDEAGVGAAVWLEAAYGWVELFTGDSLPDADRRRKGLGVEPMTCPPNAFATGVGVVRLEPGESTTARWGVVPLRG